MKFSKVILVLLVLGTFFLVACGGSKPAAPTGPQQSWRPDWYDAPSTADYNYSYGFAERANDESARTAAMANALQDAAIKVEAHVKTLIENVMEEAGMSLEPEVITVTNNITKAVANAKFSGATQSKSWVGKLKPTDTRSTAFVQYAIPVNQINREFLNSVKHEEAIYARFRGNQAFDRLEAEVNR